MTLSLGSTYEYSHARREGRQRILLEPGLVSRRQTERTHEVLIDETVQEALFALDWYERYWAELELALIAPDGTLIEHPGRPYTFPDPFEHTTHVGWRIPRPEPGLWKLRVRFRNSEAQDEIPYQVLVSGRSRLTLHLLLPTRLGIQYTTGLRFPIYAVLSDLRPVPDASLQAVVTAPDGKQTLVRLYDDGQHDDGRPRDGLYAGVYTRVNQALAVQPRLERGVEQPPPALDEGAYRVRLVARGRGDRFRREALGSFAVLEGGDRNRNRLPDIWEQVHGVTDPNGDPDLDYLFNGDEYLAGTDPHNSDSDGGGENDGSEVEHGQDPLDPSDDQIEAPGFLQVSPRNQAVHVTYDVKREYARMELWRAPDPAGPWNLVVQALPRTGAYDDRVANDRRYVYRFIAEDSTQHRSVVLESVGVVPSVDPVPPEGVVIINGGAFKTDDLAVRLTFAPQEAGLTDTTASFEDIAQMIVSNNPFFRGARWQTFAQGVRWTLDAEEGELAKVYVRFRDRAGNESQGTEVGMIWYRPQEGIAIHLPLVLKQFEE